MNIGKNHFIILAAFSCLWTLSTNSQAQDAQRIGVKAGLTAANLTNQNDFSLKPGLQAGAYAVFGGGEALFFKGELLLSQKGAWTWGNEGLGNFSLYYIDLPLMFGIDVLQGLTLNLGIQPSMLVGGTLRQNTSEGTNWRNISNDVSRMDFSTLFGAEYIIKKDWFLGFRFNYSFVPIQNHQGDLTVENQEQLMSSRVYQFYVGHRLK